MPEGYSNVKFLSCSCCYCLVFFFLLATYVCACMHACVRVCMSSWNIVFLSLNITHVLLRLPPVWFSKLVLFCRWQSNAIANYDVEFFVFFLSLCYIFHSVSLIIGRFYIVSWIYSRLLSDCIFLLLLLILIIHRLGSHLFPMSYALILI